MVDSNSDDLGPDTNIFKIMDSIIYQLNKTKKMFIIMILTIMILPPIGLLIGSLIFAPPYEDTTPPKNIQYGGQKYYKILNLRIVPLVISAAWLGIGIRQWFILSKWTKKYERYKKLQEEVNKKLDDSNNGQN
jgi:energy-coupling factor transporter transmembrane protein EcfT